MKREMVNWKKFQYWKNAATAIGIGLQGGLANVAGWAGISANWLCSALSQFHLWVAEENVHH